jgi:hypothetical protein
VSKDEIKKNIVKVREEREGGKFLGERKTSSLYPVMSCCVK